MKKIVTFILLVGTTVVVAQQFGARDFIGLTQAEQRKLVEKAVFLKSGDSFQTVTNALGKPDVDRTNGGRADRPGEPAIRQLYYYLSRPKGATFDDPDTKYVYISLVYETQKVNWVIIKAALR